MFENSKIERPNMSVGVNPVLEKIQKIAAGGRAAVESGTVKMFEGFPDELIHRANVSFKMGLVQDTVVWDVYKCAYWCGLHPFTAELNYPLHFTLLEAGVEKDKWSEVGKLWPLVDELLEDVTVTKTFSLGDCFKFDHVVLNGNGDVLLMAEEIPANVLYMRLRLTELYKSFGFAVKPMDDIMHMTIQRLSRTAPGQLKCFASSLKDSNDNPSGQIKGFADGVWSLKPACHQARAIALFRGASMALVNSFQ
jgi:hypothetical protein